MNKKTEPLSIASLLCGSIAVLIPIMLVVSDMDIVIIISLTFLFELLTLILSIVCLIKIKRNKRELKGNWLVLTSFIMCIVAILTFCTSFYIMMDNINIC